MKKPLNYAILQYFLNVKEASADDVMSSLKDTYQGSKAFKKPAVVEALMAAEANGLLDESRFDLDDQGLVRVFYKVNDYGKKMIVSYIGA